MKYTFCLPHTDFIMYNEFHTKRSSIFKWNLQEKTSNIQHIKYRCVEQLFLFQMEVQNECHYTNIKVTYFRLARWRHMTSWFILTIFTCSKGQWYQGLEQCYLMRSQMHMAAFYLVSQKAIIAFPEYMRHTVRLQIYTPNYEKFNKSQLHLALVP